MVWIVENLHLPCNLLTKFPLFLFLEGTVLTCAEEHMRAKIFAGTNLINSANHTCIQMQGATLVAVLLVMENSNNNAAVVGAAATATPGFASPERKAEA